MLCSVSVKASVLKKRVIIQMDYYPFFVCTVTPEPIALLDVRGTSAQQRPERSGEATTREYGSWSNVRYFIPEALPAV